MAKYQSKKSDQDTKRRQQTMFARVRRPKGEGGGGIGRILRLIRLSTQKADRNWKDVVDYNKSVLAYRETGVLLLVAALQQ